jgi:hypothetical protein
MQGRRYAVPDLLGLLQATEGEAYGSGLLVSITLMFSVVLLPIFFGAIWGVYRLTRGSRAEECAERGGWRDLLIVVLLLLAFGIGTCYLSLFPRLLR